MGEAGYGAGGAGYNAPGGAGYGAEAGAPPASGAGYGAQGGAGYGAEPGAPQAGYGAGPGAPQAGYGAGPGAPQAGYGAEPGTPQAGYGAQPGGAGYGTEPGGAGYAAPPGGPAGYGAPQTGPAPVPSSAPGYGPPTGGQPQGGWSPGQGTAPAFSFDTKRWTPADMVVGVASLVVLIGLFLPWFTVSLGPLGSGSESGTSAHGWLWIVFVVVLVILAYLVLKAGFERMPFTLPAQHELLLLIATGLNLLLVLIAFIAKPSAPFGVQVGWGVGAFLALIAAIVAVAPLVLAVRDLASGSRRRNA